MQTFLPYPDFVQSAKVLDNKRLGKQRVETMQLYRALTEKEYGWKNHPAAKMWKGYTQALIRYGIVVCLEWRARGFKDTMLPQFQAFSTDPNPTNPSWIGDGNFHASHRSNLLRKDSIFYGKFGWVEPSNLPYIWPTP